MLSHTPFWKNMAIIVTEDDAQDGRDSIDAHRSLLMVISPYARRGYAMRGHSSIAGIFKTIYLRLGALPLNQYDAAATDLREVLTDQPDFTPYKCRDVDARIFDPKKVRMISHSKEGGSVYLADPADFEESHRRQTIESQSPQRFLTLSIPGLRSLGNNPDILFHNILCRLCNLCGLCD